MPNYNANVATGTPMKCLYPSDPPAVVFSAEQPAVPQLSQQVSIGGVYENAPGTLSVEGRFSGAPGAFEVDLMTADTDTDANQYQLEGSGITAVGADGVSFRAEFQNVSANFAALLLKSRANAVTLTARISRR